ncbi:DUF2157 domain-containing protein [Lentibacillus saliphilus]|uniref:DUF2157 domain-containing protein n=1 Tax=Lentibacillus saliphilus TaxID=2737028 RepID=UPI001C30C801|nr:DUF2157 domain-containing protein [Lentibacillus saliphilus]
MNRTKLQREGTKWVRDGVITEAQLETLLARYTKKDPNGVIILFAILLTGLGIITFMFSEWAQVAHLSRPLVLMMVMLLLYVCGDQLYRKRSSSLGVSFIILGYIVFGTGLLHTMNIYNMTLLSAWPFIIWAIIGLLLYVVYDHKLIFMIGLIVVTVGQIYSGSSFSAFNWFIFLVLLFGFAHFVYHRSSLLFGYGFAASFIIQLIVLAVAESQAYYWPIVYILAIYIISDIISHHALKIAFKRTALIAIIIFGVNQTFYLQTAFWDQDQVERELSFIIVWALVFSIAALIKRRKKQLTEWVDLILFLPVAYVPFSYLLSNVILFVFAIVLLFIGYKTEDNHKIQFGTVTFLLSTFTAYIQFAWDEMNKSLFFLIGGVLLFGLSFILEKRRRAVVEGAKGDDV